MTSVVIMGNSISAHLSAAYIKKNNPDFDVVIIGPKELTHPIVGESLIEASTYIFFELGLGTYLEEHHFHKYSLAFYYKAHLDNPKDRTYAVHEGLSIPPMPSFLINRFTLRDKLISLNRELGVRFIHSLAKKVNTLGFRKHIILYGEGDETKSIEANWVIDTTGRRRLLSRQNNLLKEAPVQRCAFWFRLANFDRHFLDKINMVKQYHKNYDTYYCAHHFFDTGNWTWLIPISSQDEQLISIGMVWRPDLFPKMISNVDEFCAHLEKVHPVVSDLVKTGTVLDENFYKNYLYHSKQLYSPTGWFIVADAGNTVDPLYSPGIAFTSLQVHQINAMIQKGEQGSLDEKFVKTLEDAHLTSFHTMQDAVTRQYEGMHDPYQMHLYVHTLVTAYFYFLLPCWLAKYHTDTIGAKFLTKITNKAQDSLASLYDLIAFSSRYVGKVPPEKITNYVRRSVNADLCGPNEAEIPKHLAKMLMNFAYFRFLLLRNAKWKGWMKHMPVILGDLFKALVFRTVFRNTPLRTSKLIKLFVSGKVEFRPCRILRDRPEMTSDDAT